MPRLIVVTPDGERTLDLSPGQTVMIGRDPSNTLPLPSETKASRRHCRVSPAEGTPGAWEVADLGSTNKTRVNGAVADRRVLTSGDVIEVGSVRIRFEDPEEEGRLREAGEKGVCFLEWATADRKGQKVLLSAPRTTIGRRETNTIVLQDRMASGHHAEIMRDINGYTIRDLGSMNGTLVNGQPTTEAPLAHGSRIRIGNSRFLFKDPSMKDIEVELAQFDEDEGWGMMGELDLSRAPGSRAGPLVALALFLAAGVGGYFLVQQSGRRATTQEARAENLVADGDFEEPGADVAWAPREDAPVVVRLEKDGGGQALSLSLPEAEVTRPGLVTYRDEFEPIGTRPFVVRSRLRGSGAELVVVWEARPTKEEVRAGHVPLVRTSRLAPAEGGWKRVEVSVVPPSWATAGRLGVRLVPGGRASLDDVSLTSGVGEGSRPEIALPEFRSGRVNSDGTVDVLAMSTVLFVGAAPAARLEDGTLLLGFFPSSPSRSGEGGAVEVAGSFRHEGRDVPASVRWSATKEGLEALVACEGAKQTGLAVDYVAAHLSGVLNVLPVQTLATTPGQRFGNVSKVLAGSPDTMATRPSTLVAFSYAQEGEPEARAAGTLEVAAADDPDLVRLVHWSDGPTARLELITDFTLQQGQAKARLADAKQVARERPGRAIRLLREIAQEYPFEKAVATEALNLADQLEKESQKTIDDASAAFDRYRIYRSGEALAAVEKQLAGLRAQFPADGDGMSPGPQETRVAELAVAVEQARWDHDRRNALPEIQRLERVADLLAEDEQYRVMAVLYGRAILQRFGGALEKDDSELGRRLKAIRERVEGWESQPAVKDALPPGAP